MIVDNDIKFGVFLPRWGNHATPDAFRRVTLAAADAGYDSVWRSDHITFQEYMSADTYTFGNEPPFHISQSAHESFQVLAHLAAITDDVNLGINVCVVPYRHPVLLAKLCLTLISLSNGRFELGVGTGWLKTEFEVLDKPFDQRGSRTDEFLDLFERARSEGEVAFDGPHHAFPKTGFYPSPKSSNDPPIWVGGRSGAAFRRVAEFGDGWTIVGDTPDEVRSARRRIMQAWNDFDREGEPEILVAINVDLDQDESKPASPMIGNVDEIQDSIEEYVDAGTTHFVFDFQCEDADHQIEQLELLADHIPST